MLGAEFMSGDSLCALQLLGDEFVDFFESGLIDAYDLAQYFCLFLQAVHSSPQLLHLSPMRFAISLRCECQTSHKINNIMEKMALSRPYSSVATWYHSIYI